MPVLQLTYAPDPIFKQHSTAVETVDDEVRALISDMFDTLSYEQGIGMAAPMVGILRRVVVINMVQEGEAIRCAMVNPTITQKSEKTHTGEEASLCFPSISAQVTRPEAVTVDYLDENGAAQTMQAKGFLATVIQHEIDYLNGIVFLDYLSKMKRDMLLRKMQKHLKQNPPHVHGAHCGH